MNPVLLGINWRGVEWYRNRRLQAGNQSERTRNLWRMTIRVSRTGEYFTLRAFLWRDVGEGGNKKESEGGEARSLMGIWSK